MVEHWSEKPGVDSSILSLGILFYIIRLIILGVNMADFPDDLSGIVQPAFE